MKTEQVSAHDDACDPADAECSYAARFEKKIFLQVGDTLRILVIPKLVAKKSEDESKMINSSVDQFNDRNVQEESSQTHKTMMMNNSSNSVDSTDQSNSKRIDMSPQPLDDNVFMIDKDNIKTDDENNIKTDDKDNIKTDDKNIIKTDNKAASDTLIKYFNQESYSRQIESSDSNVNQDVPEITLDSLHSKSVATTPSKVSPLNNL